MTQTDQIITDFIAEGKSLYGPMFFLERIPQPDGPDKLVLMTESLAQKLRDKFNSHSTNDQKVVSLDKDEAVGKYYRVKKGQIAKLLNHPGQAECARLLHNLPDPKMLTSTVLPDGRIEIENELMSGELVRGIVSSSHPNLIAVAVCHDFESLAPKAMGWVNLKDNIEEIPGRELSRPEKLTLFEQAVQTYLGLPYHLGGKSIKSGYDCSSLSQQIIYDTKGIWLPKISSWQILVGEEVTDLIPSDLAFFRENHFGTIEHMAVVYQINGRKHPIVVNANASSGSVLFEDLNDSKWLEGKYVIDSYRRILS